MRTTLLTLVLTSAVAAASIRAASVSDGLGFRGASVSDRMFKSAVAFDCSSDVPPNRPQEPNRGADTPRSPQAYVPSLVMEDQFEQTHDVKSYRGSVLVLIYGDRTSAKTNQQLGEMIHVGFHPDAKGKAPAEARKAPVRPVSGAMPGTRHPEVMAIPVACVGKVPPLIGRVIKNSIRNGSPSVPVWLDFSEQMKTQFPFTAGVPNVVVLDVHGRYRYVASGVPTTESTTKLMGVVESLRKEAIEGK